ncbi:unnamed protein product [Protopolystoma xenopodis]|uniref:Uncharacterized protein n=1 Tax=Protopolystoma xenopodis TaxID=117903 RepID=A0A448XJ48_9PLAT|nr:unnamed protein product [Protopolystoma xenopodis]
MTSCFATQCTIFRWQRALPSDFPDENTCAVYSAAYGHLFLPPSRPERCEWYRVRREKMPILIFIAPYPFRLVFRLFFPGYSGRISRPAPRSGWTFDCIEASISSSIQASCSTNCAQLNYLYRFHVSTKGEGRVQGQRRCHANCPGHKASINLNKINRG